MARLPGLRVLPLTARECACHVRSSGSWSPRSTLCFQTQRFQAQRGRPRFPTSFSADRDRRAKAPPARETMMMPRREIPPAETTLPDFNRFLYAEIWIEASGMPLSVVSALARLGLDAPREARRLATLRRAAAGLVLLKTIERLPDRPAAIDVAGTAARLVLLLPAAAVLADGRAATADPARGRGVRNPLAWQLALIVILTAWLVYSATSRPSDRGDAEPAQRIVATGGQS